MNMMSTFFAGGGLRAAIVAAALALTPMSAHAATIIYDGETTNIGPGPMQSFAGKPDAGTGGAGSWTHTFSLSLAGAGEGQVTITSQMFGNFTDLVARWVDATTDSILASVSVGSPQSFLNTSFDDPNTLTQRFELVWSDSVANSGFDVGVDITPIPVPAAGFLLIGALGGLGLLARRRKKDA